MKTNRFTKHISSALVLASLTTVSAGCKTAGWSSGSKLFSWNREPDPTLLSSGANASEYPEGPANKYEPTSVAALGSQTGTAASLAASRGTGYSSPGQTTSTPQAGLAAQANGYQTGAYPTGGTQPPATPTSGGMPSPYGGTYTGSTPSGSASAAPKSNVASNTPASPYPTASAYASSPYGAGQSSAPSAYAGLPSPNTAGSAAGLPAYPVASSSTAPGLPTQTGASLQSMLPGSTMPDSAMPARPTGYPSSTVSTTTSLGLPTSPTGLPGAGTGPATDSLPSAGLPTSGTAMAAPSAYRGSTTLGGFSPGTTGRSTGYDFGGGQASESPAAGTTTLPPNTANTGNPLLR